MNTYIRIRNQFVLHLSGTYIEGTRLLSILPVFLPVRELGIRRDKYLSAAIFKKAVHGDDP